jgi:hypothetical protein
MNKENLLKLAEVLESEQAQKHFDMTQWITHHPNYNNLDWQEHHERVNESVLKEAVKDCGTVACIAGWAATLATPDQKLIFVSGASVQQTAEDWLELDKAEAVMLFIPWSASYYADRSKYKRNSNTITAGEAARVVRHLAETGKVDWSVIDE